MHLEILIEDQSGKKLLDIIVPKLIGANHTFRVHAYRGIGRIPKNLKGKTDPSKRILLDQLPRLLEGYGNAFSKYPDGYEAHVAVICDLDNKNAEGFLKELSDTLDRCKKKPATAFCLAIEEGEAWLLGDKTAIETAYPKAQKAVLQSYKYDSICGTWELLADAVYPGGSAALKSKGWQAIGYEKFIWAGIIGPLVDATRNASPSFQSFRKDLQSFGY